MTKKIYILFILILLLVSCGKKNDPTYKTEVQNLKNTYLLLS